MPVSTTIRAADSHFQAGTRCLLVLMGHRFLVSIIRVAPETIRLSFPTGDFPVEGMRVELEFHDEAGYASYETEILEGPRQVGDGLLVKRPSEMNRNQHRSSWRVPTDLEADLKGHVHPRRYRVRVLNLSAGGLLGCAETPLVLGDTVELSLALPGFEQAALTAQVVHTAAAGGAEAGQTLVGLQFVALDPAVRTGISRYLWRRLRELYPSDYTFLRRKSDLPPAAG